MPTPEEQFTEALRDVDDTLEEVKATLVDVRNIISVEPIDADNVPNRVMVTDGSGNTTTSSITTTELSYLDNLTGNVQSQLNNKLAGNLGVADRILRTDASGNVVTTSSVTVEELNALDGVSSNVQTQLNSKQPKNIGVSNKVVITDGSGNITAYADIDASLLKALYGLRYEDAYGLSVVHRDANSTVDASLRLMVNSTGVNIIGSSPIVIQAGSVNHSTANSANAYYDTTTGKYYAFYGHTTSDVEMGVYGIEEPCVWTGDPNFPLRLRGSEVTVNGNNIALKSGWTKSRALATNANGNIAISNTTTAELHHLMGVTANVQEQLDGKAPNTLSKSNSIVVTSSSGVITASASVTTAELNMLKNVKSNLQTQIDDKQTQITSIKANTLVGEVKWLAFSDSVTGWLLCDGRAVSRADYSALFAAIGTTWGAGDGSTTFNLPNLIDKTVWGGSTAGGYKEAGLPDHDHSYSSYPRHGAEAHPDITTARWCDGFEGTETAKVTGTSTKASASNSIYGKSTTVQPPAAVLRPVIKY